MLWIGLVAAESGQDLLERPTFRVLLCTIILSDQQSFHHSIAHPINRTLPLGQTGRVPATVFTSARRAREIARKQQSSRAALSTSDWNVLHLDFPFESGVSNSTSTQLQCVDKP